jgi:hypothetical protein
MTPNATTDTSPIATLKTTTPTNDDADCKNADRDCNYD